MSETELGYQLYGVEDYKVYRVIPDVGRDFIGTVHQEANGIWQGIGMGLWYLSATYPTREQAATALLEAWLAGGTG